MYTKDAAQGQEAISQAAPFMNNRHIAASSAQ